MSAQSVHDTHHPLTESVNTADILINTDNPLNTDTRYNDKILYNDNLTVTKPLIKR